jgi:hypothetical protein
MQPDPMMQHASPYLAMANNPTSFTDPLGLTAQDYIGYDFYTKKEVVRQEAPGQDVETYLVWTKNGTWFSLGFKDEIDAMMGFGPYAFEQVFASKFDYFATENIQINYAPNVVNDYRIRDQQNADRAKFNSVVERGLIIKGLLPDVTDMFNNTLQGTRDFFSRNSTRFNGPFGLKMIHRPISTFRSKLSFFKSQVGTNAPYDIKQKGKGYSPSDLGANYAFYNGQLLRYDDFGNYNYGVAAAAFGIPLNVALMGAGYNQTFQTGSPDWSNPSGYFDHSRDTKFIIQGYNHKFK